MNCLSTDGPVISTDISIIQTLKFTDKYSQNSWSVGN